MADSHVSFAPDASSFSNGAGAAPQALTIEPRFCPTNVVDPFETVDWSLRTAVIKGEGGDILFEQNNCEVPANWTQLATNVVVSKYFYGENGTPEREKSVRQLIHRVTRTIADWGTRDGYFASQADGENFYRELTWLCLHQHGCFNSPVWFNVGLYHQYGVKGGRGNYRWLRTGVEWRGRDLTVEGEVSTHDYGHGVKPGARLSLQSHRHRSEHWTVVAGTGEVTLGMDRASLATKTVATNESIYIPLGAIHRVANQGSEPLTIIEVQCGDYLGEDDIERYEDDYGRS